MFDLTWCTSTISMLSFIWHQGEVVATAASPTPAAVHGSPRILSHSQISKTLSFRPLKHLVCGTLALVILCESLGDKASLASLGVTTDAGIGGEMKGCSLNTERKQTGCLQPSTLPFFLHSKATKSSFLCLKHLNPIFHRLNTQQTYSKRCHLCAHWIHFDLTSVARLSFYMCEGTRALHSSILFLLLTALTHPAGSNIANLCPPFKHLRFSSRCLLMPLINLVNPFRMFHLQVL